MQITTSTGTQTPRDPNAPVSLDHVLPTAFRATFYLVTVLFFLWGMSNNLTDILVQQFKKSFELTPLEAQLVQTANFFGYFCMALPAAFFMRRFGYKAGILIGLCLFGSGLLLFWPAAVIGKYGPFLLAIFVIGCGLAILETAANPFIAQFGPSSTSERRLNLAQAFNPPGTIVGVILGTFFIFSGVELSPDKVALMRSAGTYTAYLHTEIMRVVPTYVGLGVIVLLWAAFIARSKFPSLESEQDSSDHGSITQLFRYPHLWLAIVAQFCYVGAQVGTWSALIPYTKQYTGVSERTAAFFLIGNLVAFALGRIVSTPLMRYIKPATMVGAYAVINIALLAVAILHPSMIGVGAILLSSLFMSIMYPTIFALGVKGLGPNTKLASSLIVMSVVGAAVLPAALGYVVKLTNSYALGYTVALACYIVVALYGFLGSPTKDEPLVSDPMLFPTQPPREDDGFTRAVVDL